MRICVIDEGSKRCKYEFSYLGDFRNNQIYLASLFCGGSERARRRRFRRLLWQCRKKSVSLFAIHSENSCSALFLKFGIGYVDEKRLYMPRIAEMAVLFSETVSAPRRFFIAGGTVKDVSNIACELLSECRFVYADCAGFTEASELVLDKMGVPLQESCDEPCVRIHIKESGAEFFWGEKSAAFSDFHIGLSGDRMEELSDKAAVALLSMLETCGVLCKNEIKTVCLVK